MPLLDQDLPARAQQGDENALAALIARMMPAIRKGAAECTGVQASKGATTTSWGCRFTARRSCCASLPDPDSPGNGSLYGKNLQLFYMLFRENTRYVYQRHRH